MRDHLGRPLEYLRISVTDRCNLRCRYCMPEEGIELLPRDEILSFEEIEAVVRVAARHGIEKLRITGGEPLVRRGTVELIGRLVRIPGIRRCSLTTNGTFLRPVVRLLRECGVTSINISIDTLDEAKYRELTRGGELRPVIEGLEAAVAEGARACTTKEAIFTVKVNVVLLNGVNDDEIAQFVELTRERPIEVRFIEFMPFGEWKRFNGAEVQGFNAASHSPSDRRESSEHPAQRGDSGSGSNLDARCSMFSRQSAFLPATRVFHELEKFGSLEPVAPNRWAGPAEVFRIRGFRGRVGVIQPVSKPFCGVCNRLRLTADGRLKLCLLRDLDIDLKPYLREGKGRLEEAFQLAARLKPAGHAGTRWTMMSGVGG